MKDFMENNLNIIITAIMILVVVLVIIYHLVKQSLMKKRCTVPVSARLISLNRTSSSDGAISYIAAYTYSYEGKEYTAKLDVSNELDYKEIIKETLGSFKAFSEHQTDEFKLEKPQWKQERTLLIDPEKPSRCIKDSR